MAGPVGLRSSAEPGSPSTATTTRVLALLAVIGLLLLLGVPYAQVDSSNNISKKALIGLESQPMRSQPPRGGRPIGQLVNDWLGFGNARHAYADSPVRAAARIHPTSEAVRLCPTCNCSQEGAYANDPAFAIPLPTIENLRMQIEERGSFSTMGTLRYLLHHIPLASSLQGLWLPGDVAAGLLKQQLTCPDAIISFNFTGLALDKPTQYIYTRTGPGGRLKTWTDREPYMRRHVETFRDFQEIVATEGYEDGVSMQSRQFLWIMVEDAASIDPGQEKLLRNSGLPYLYFAHGPTNHFGTAQWNVIIKAIQVLRDSFFGDGPVYNLDDDARILPVLLVKLWRLRRAVAFQVGNLNSFPAPFLWEGPIYENGKLVSWNACWKPTRVFPIDMNGFSINSSMIGGGRPMSPPQYIPFNAVAGESEYLEQIYPAREDIEPLCRNTKQEHCYYAWHNSWIREDHRDADPPE